MTDSVTAPTLPDTLARLAQLLPERVRGTGGYRWSTFYVSSSVFDTEAVWSAYDDQIETNPLRLHLLEFALREECDARGWHWEIGCGHAEVGDGDRRRVVVSWRDLPDGNYPHALAVAVVRWIASEEMGEGWW